MATYICHWLIMGKNENWHLLLSHCRYFDKGFIEMFLEWSSTKRTNLLYLIGYHGNQKAKFAKTYSKVNFSEAVWGIKLKLCRIVSNNSLYKNIVFIAVAQALWLLRQLKVSIDLQWEKWKLRFIAISLQLFWQKFCRNVFEWSSTKHIILDQTSHFGWLPWQPKC